MNTTTTRRNVLIGTALTLGALTLSTTAANATTTNTTATTFTTGKYHIIEGKDITYTNPFQWVRGNQTQGFFPVATKASTDQLIYANYTTTIPTKGSTYARVLSRRTTDNKNYYAAVAAFNADGTHTLSIERVTNNKAQRLNIKTNTTTLTPGTTITFELSIRTRSTTIEAALLIDGTPTLETIDYTETKLPITSTPSGLGTGAAAYISKTTQGATLTLNSLTSEEFGEFRGPRHHQTWGTPTFEDDFDEAQYQGTNNLNPTKWNTRQHDYSKADIGITKRENVRVANGALELWTTRLPKGQEVKTKIDTREWATAYIDTIGKFDAQYFRAEIRMRTPNSTKAHKGAWGGLWFRPTNTSYQGEIDVAEAFGYTHGVLKTDQSNRALTTFHYDQTGKNKTDAWQPSLGQQSANEYHTWIVERTEAGLKVWCDGRQVLTVANDAKFKKALPDSEKMTVRLNTQAGQKSYWGIPDADTQDHVLKVDYIRVWTK